MPTDRTSKDAAPLTFLVVSASYQCAQWVARSLRSVQAQSYPHFRHVLVDDCSTDGTPRIAREAVAGDDRFSVVVNTDRRYPLANIVRGVEAIGGGAEDVIVVLDGDDWLKHPRVLEHLAAVYRDPEVWLTYGSHELLKRGRRATLLGRQVVGRCYAYPEVVAELGAYRYYDFIAQHLRTSRRFLWQAIRDEDLRDDDGGYYRAAADVATMLPMLEMATPKHWRHIDEVLHVYNNQHTLSENRPGSRSEQLRVSMLVRAKPRYAPLQREPGSAP